MRDNKGVTPNFSMDTIKKSMTISNLIKQFNYCCYVKLRRRPLRGKRGKSY